MSHRVNFLFAGIGFLSAANSLAHADWLSAALSAVVGGFFTYVGVRKLKRQSNA